MADLRRNLHDRLKNTFRGSLTVAGQLNNTFEVMVAHGTELEMLLKPSYWWPVNREIRPLRDRIECIWEDGSRIAVLRCMGKDERGETMMFAVLSDVKFEAPEVPAGHSLIFVSAATGWRVMRDGQQSAMRSGFATAMEAAAWLNGDLAPDEDDEDDEGDPKAKGGKGGRTRAVKPKTETEAA